LREVIHSVNAMFGIKDTAAPSSFSHCFTNILDCRSGVASD